MTDRDEEQRTATVRRKKRPEVEAVDAEPQASTAKPAPESYSASPEPKKSGRVMQAPETKVRAPEPLSAKASSPSAPAAPAAPADTRSFAEMLGDSKAPAAAQRISTGDQVLGTVVLCGKDSVFVEIMGSRSQGAFRKELVPNAAVGDEVAGYVLGKEGDTYELGVSMGGDSVSLDQLEAALRDGTFVEGKVAGVNRGGVRVEIGKVKCFCPMSQLDRGFVHDATVFLNQTHKFVVTEIKEGKDVILSRRAVLKKQDAENAKEKMATIQVGAQLDGKIESVRDFGAFVDLGDGLQGLIPKREISYERREVADAVSTGDFVKVQVIDIGEKKGKIQITLSLKALAQNPWDAINTVAPVGKVIHGRVSKLMDFGAFVELVPGVEGLLHVSELGSGQKHPSSYVSVGQQLLVIVQSVDTTKQRVSLTMAGEGTEVGQQVEQRGVINGSVVKAKVVEIARWGVFVQVEGTSGRAGRGLIPHSELGTPHGADLRKLFPEGGEVTAKVLQGAPRLRLSIEAAKADAERAVFDQFKQEQAASAKMGTFADLLRDKLKK